MANILKILTTKEQLPCGALRSAANQYGKDAQLWVISWVVYSQSGTSSVRVVVATTVNSK